MQVKSQLLITTLVTVAAPGQLFENELGAAGITYVAFGVTQAATFQPIREALYTNAGWNLRRHPFACPKWAATVTALFMWSLRAGVLAQAVTEIDGNYGPGAWKTIPHLQVAFEVIH